MDHHHRHEHVFDTPEMAAATEVEGDALYGLTSAAVDATVQACRAAGVDAGRIVDLGSGPGVGSCLLATAFPAATVVAADASTAMLDRAAARAARLGVGARVETRHVDLPGGLDELGTADVVWVSMALHHVGDEADALAGIHRLLAPGGVLTLVEHGGPVRVLPDHVDLGRPGIWERLDAAWASWFAGMRAALPASTASAGYPEMLAAAGFEVLVDEVITQVDDPPLGDAARRFAGQQVQSACHQLDGIGDPADLAVLQRLADPEAADGIAHRADAVLHARRHLFIARA